MDGSIPKITESLAAHAITPQRERRREQGPAFRLPAPEPEPDAQEPTPARELEPRPVAAPEEGEPGTRLDLRG